MKAIPVFVLAVFAACTPEKQHADLLLSDVNVVLPEGSHEKMSVAVVDGKIAAFGKTDSIAAYWESARTLSLPNDYLYAGFIDAHAHFLGYGLGLQNVDLRGSISWEEVLQRVRDFQASRNVNFITGRGWDQNDWEDKTFPDRTALDSLFPDIPVLLRRIDGHAAIANGAALEYAEISAGTKIDGGVVVTKNGWVTGVLIDNAAALVVPPRPTVGKKASALVEAEKNIFAAGLTSVADAGLHRTDIKLIDSLQQAGVLKLRIYAMVSDHPDAIEYYTKAGPYKTDRLNVRSFKFYGDGALGSRGACLLAPYHDDPGNYGLMVTDIGHLRAAASRLKDAGFQLNTHAIGDSANRVILQIYSENIAPGNDLRWRIEHAQVIHPSDFETFGKYNIIPSVQPTHATSDMYWAEDRLGTERVQHAYAYQHLLNEAGLLALGTDFPIEDIDPLKTFYAAVARKDAAGYPDSGFQRENAISRGDALRGMTEWAAYAQFEEDEKGRIAVGMFADFTILDTDLLHCEEEQILSSCVKYTIVNGEILYSK